MVLQVKENLLYHINKVFHSHRISPTFLQSKYYIVPMLPLNQMSEFQNVYRIGTILVSLFVYVSYRNLPTQFYLLQPLSTHQQLISYQPSLFHCHLLILSYLENDKIHPENHCLCILFPKFLVFRNIFQYILLNIFQPLPNLSYAQF